MAEHGAVLLGFSHAGALAGDWVIFWEVPNAFMPRHISAVGSNDHDATLKVGISTSEEAILADIALGVSGDPAEFGPSDFADADYQVTKGDILKMTVTYGGAGGTAIQNPTVVVKGLLGL